MSDSDKPIGYDMAQKPTDKLSAFYLGVFLFVAIVSVEISKPYMRVGYFLYPVIAYGNFVGISPEIFQYGFRTFERLFAIDNPVGVVQLVLQPVPLLLVFVN